MNIKSQPEILGVSGATGWLWGSVAIANFTKIGYENITAIVRKERANRKSQKKLGAKTSN
ncbi:hypothetical protein P5503_14570 (plasmid) [Staphylococcus aureus]